MKIRSFVEVGGIQYYNTAAILRHIVTDLGGIWNIDTYQEHEIELVLVPEPENQYHSGAIAVYSDYQTPEDQKTRRDGKLGYLPKEIKIHLYEPILVEATVKEGLNQLSLKVNIAGIIDDRDYPQDDFEQNYFQYSEHVPASDNIRVNKFVFAGLAIFLGFFGIQWFYAHRIKKALLYIAFFWTGIPFLLGIYEGIRALMKRTDSSLMIDV